MGDGDIVTNMMNERLFGGGAPMPVTDPGDGGYDRFRTEGEAAASIPSGSMPSVNATDAARAADLVSKIALMLQRTNITASLPAHVEPTPWSNPIDLSKTVALAGAVSGYQTVLTYTAAPGRYGRISGFGVDVDNSYAYNGTLLWRLLLNGVDPGGLTDWGEHRGSVIQPRSTVIIVPEGQTVVFQVKRDVAAGGVFNVAMAMVGWTWRLRNNFQGSQASIAGV